MNTSDNLYVRLFHGRNRPDESMSDWGFDGPVIGPVGVSWTYGSLKLHAPGWNDHEELRTRDALVWYDGKYYGDLEIMTAEDPGLTDAVLSSDERIHDYARFVATRRAQDRGPNL